MFWPNSGNKVLKLYLRQPKERTGPYLSYAVVQDMVAPNSHYPYGSIWYIVYTENPFCISAIVIAKLCILQ